MLAVTGRRPKARVLRLVLGGVLTTYEFTPRWESRDGRSMETAILLIRTREVHELEGCEDLLTGNTAQQVWAALDLIAPNRAKSGRSAEKASAAGSRLGRAAANRGAAAVSSGKARNRASSRTKSAPQRWKTRTASPLLREKGWTPHVSGDGRGGSDE